MNLTWLALTCTVGSAAGARAAWLPAWQPWLAWRALRGPWRFLQALWRPVRSNPRVAVWVWLAFLAFDVWRLAR